MVFSTGPLTQVGTITKTHGYEGRVRLDLDEQYEINTKEPLFLMFNQKPVPFFIEHITSSNPFIVSLADISSIEQAQLVLGKDVYYPTEMLEIEDDDNLIDFEIVDAHLGSIGKVKDFVDNSAQTLMVVSGANGEHLIPFVDEFIVEILPDEHRINVELPDGLLNLD
ncbi:MAG: 16S rRNA processing protein RimM [Bacteroidia bacterium]|nr:16S rRNA processing protein RimM [Bacteroidia bacterium]